MRIRRIASLRCVVDFATPSMESVADIVSCLLPSEEQQIYSEVLLVENKGALHSSRGTCLTKQCSQTLASWLCEVRRSATDVQMFQRQIREQPGGLDLGSLQLFFAATVVLGDSEFRACSFWGFEWLRILDREQDLEWTVFAL